MPPKIFINYRKEDSPWNSVALYQELIKHFPPENIFKDFNTIKPGYDFVDSIEEALQTCDVLLVLINDNWLEMKDKNGNRRIDDSDDFVRIEIATAFKRKIPVIPILFDNAMIPRSDELPEDLKPLTRRQGINMGRTRFTGDALSLVQAINNITPDDSVLAEIKQTSKEEKPKQPSKAQITDNQRTIVTSNANKNFNKKIYWGIGGVAFVFLITIISNQFNKGHSTDNLNSEAHRVSSSGTDTTVISVENNIAPRYLSEVNLLTLPDDFNIPDDSLKYYKEYGKLLKVKGSDGIPFNYEGGVLNGKPNGYGVAVYEVKELGRMMYRGNFINGDCNGKGIMMWKNGEKYVGDWKGGKMNGKGIFTWKNGEKYEGDYKDDEKDGKGTYTWPGGDKYIGDWKKNRIDGYGEGYKKNGFVNNCPGCCTYKGYWKNNLKSGIGKCYDKNKKVLYDGLFAKDIPADQYPQETELPRFNEPPKKIP